jgi:peptidoglycan/LPS O-acetylase OafA/YrhL
MSSPARGADLPGVDVLRGVSAAMVMIYHWPVPVNPFLQNAKDLGGRGVQMFYILSAFTLLLSLNSRVEKKPLVSYTVRRVFRIVPLFWVAVCACLLLWGRSPRYWSGQEPISNANIAAAFLLLGSASPFWLNSIVTGQWSIMVESNFYLFVPFLARTLTTLRRALFGYFLVLIAAYSFRHGFGLLSPPGVPPYLWRGYLEFLLPTQAPVFMLGVLLFSVYRSGYPARPVFRRFCLLAAVAGVLFIVLPVQALPAAMKRLSESVHVQSWIFFFVALSCLGMRDSRVVSWLRFTGKISYSTYLWHYAVFYCVARYLAGEDITQKAVSLNALQAVAAIVAVYAVSALSYYAVEQPGMDLGKKLLRRLRAPQPNLKAVSASSSE